jgi:hypothetical protein
VVGGQAESTMAPLGSEGEGIWVYASAAETTIANSTASTPTDAIYSTVARCSTTTSDARSGGSWARWKSSGEESNPED